MRTTRKRSAKPPRVQGPIQLAEGVAEVWISTSLEWPVPDLLTYIAHAEQGGAVAWERRSAAGSQTIYSPLEPAQLTALATLKARLVHAETMRRGRQPGAYGALRDVLESHEADHPGASFQAIWEHLRTLASKDDDTIQEVLEDRVDWLDANDHPHSTSAKRVKNLIGEIRKT